MKIFSKNLVKGLLIMAVLVNITVVPAIAFSQSLAPIVPCGYDGAHNQPKNDRLDKIEECQFADFIIAIGGIIKGTIIIISVYAAISFMYAGYAYLTSGGSQEKVNYAKGIFKKVLAGYIILLLAWTVVAVFERAMTSEEFQKNNSFLNKNATTAP